MKKQTPNKASLFGPDMPPTTQYPKGYRVDATAADFPALEGMSISYLRLEPEGMREPHWHPNAHELNYCISGEALLTLFNPHNEHETFVLSPGDISFVPRGSLHHIENRGKTPLEMLVCFNHEQPEDLSLSAAVSSMSGHVMGATFQLPASFFDTLPKTEEGVFIAAQKEAPSYALTYAVNPFKFSLEQKNPEVNNAGGQVRMSNQTLMPTLDQLAVYSLILEKGGVREPHWHPNAHELNCLLKGHVKIHLLSPKGKREAFEMQPGDISFLPRGYFHHIENIDKSSAHMAIFFNHVFPSDIGISGSLGAYSNAVLAALFNTTPDAFASLPKYQQDLMVVKGAG